MKIGIRVLDYRTPSGAGFADAFFTTQLGVENEDGSYEALVNIKDCELRTSQKGEKYVAFPKKPRIKKVDNDTAEYQRDANGKVYYDAIVDSPREQAGTKDDGSPDYRIPKTALKFKDAIMAKVMQIAGPQAAEAQGRGTAGRTQQRANVATAASTGGRERGNPLADDDTLPF